MSNYPIHTTASAPEKSKPALEGLQQAFGVLPNLAAVVAFHTTLALQQGVSSEDTNAIRERRLATDRRFATLFTQARTLIEK